MIAVIHPPTRKPDDNSTGQIPVTGKPVSGPNTALIVGLTVPIVLIVVVAATFLIFVMCRSDSQAGGKMPSFSIGFKNENYKSDEVPFSGVIPGEGGSVTMSDNKNMEKNQSET